MFDDHDWPLNASRGFVSISWASCLCSYMGLVAFKWKLNNWTRNTFARDARTYIQTCQCAALHLLTKSLHVKTDFDTLWPRDLDPKAGTFKVKFGDRCCWVTVCTPELTMGHILWPMTLVTHQSIDPWPAWPVTHDSRLLTSHCHSATFAYPREREGSIDAIST